MDNSTEPYNPMVNLIATGKEIYRVLILVILCLLFVVGVKPALSLALLATLSAYCCTYLLELCKLYGSYKLACTFDVLQIAAIGTALVSLGLGIL